MFTLFYTVVWGECNHSFHNCCMSLWVVQNNRCPLCQQEWVVQRVGRWLPEQQFTEQSTHLFYIMINRWFSYYFFRDLTMIQCKPEYKPSIRSYNNQASSDWSKIHVYHSIKHRKACFIVFHYSGRVESIL